MADLEELACREFVEVVTDYLEGALDAHTQRLFEEHVAACSGCEIYLEQIRTTIAVAGSLRERATLERETRDALLGLFRGWTRSSPG